MCKIGIIIYSIVQFVAFVFILVGTPIDMFRARTEYQVFDNTPCLSMWGYKERCFSTRYDERIGTLFEDCEGRKTRFRAAEAFAIINIGIYGVACLMGFIMLCCCMCLRWFCLVLNIFGITSVVSWAIMAHAYVTTSDGRTIPTVLNYCYKFNDFYKFGAGFALIVVAWCLNLVNIIFLMLPC